MAMTMSQLSAKFGAASNKVVPQTSQELAKFAELGVGYVKRSIQDYHAVDTGTMVNSTTKEASGSRAYLIGPTVHYAKYVALGTSRMRARPFHIKAAEKLRSKINTLNFGPKELGIE